MLEEAVDELVEMEVVGLDDAVEVVEEAIELSDVVEEVRVAAVPPSELKPIAKK